MGTGAFRPVLDGAEEFHVAIDEAKTVRFPVGNSIRSRLAGPQVGGQHFVVLLVNGGGEDGGFLFKGGQGFGGGRVVVELDLRGGAGADDVGKCLEIVFHATAEAADIADTKENDGDQQRGPAGQHGKLRQLGFDGGLAGEHADRGRLVNYTVRSASRKSVQIERRKSKWFAHLNRAGRPPHPNPLPQERENVSRLVEVVEDPVLRGNSGS